MLFPFKQSTAFTLRLGPFLDDTDGKTAKTALTLAQADFRLSKAGGAFAQKNDATAGAHDENGYYSCVGNATDTNTLGSIKINVSKAGALPVWLEGWVYSAQVYDSLFGGTDVLQVDVAQWLNAAAPAMTGDAYARLGAPTGASVSADVAAVKGVLPAALVGGRMDASIGAVAAGVIAAGSFAAGALDAVWSATTRLLTAGTNIVLAKGVGVTGFNDIAAGAAMTLTSGERTAIANEVEAQIIDETDSEKVLVAITNKIAAANPSLSGLTLSAIASAMRSELATELGRIDVVLSSRLASANYTAPDNAGVAAIKAKTDNLPSDPADQSLVIAATNAIMTAIGDVPTNSELSVALGAADDAVLAALASLPDAAATALLAAAYEGPETVRDYLRLSRSALYGANQDMDTSAPKFKSRDGLKVRLSPTGGDEFGSRSTVATDAS